MPTPLNSNRWLEPKLNFEKRLPKQVNFSYCKNGGRYDTVNAHQHQAHFQINLDSGIPLTLQSKNIKPLIETFPSFVNVFEVFAVLK